MADQSSTRERLRRIARLIGTGDFEQAQELLETVINEDPESADAWYLAAVIAKSTDQKVEYLNHALMLNPNHARAQELRARLNPSDVLNKASSTDALKVDTPSKSNRSTRYLFLALFTLIILTFGGILAVRLGQIPTSTSTATGLATQITPNLSNLKSSATASISSSQIHLATTVRPSNTVTLTSTSTATLTHTATETPTLTPSSTFPPVSAPPPLTVLPPPVSPTSGKTGGLVQNTPPVTAPPPPVSVIPVQPGSTVQSAPPITAPPPPITPT